MSKKKKGKNVSRPQRHYQKQNKNQGESSQASSSNAAVKDAGWIVGVDFGTTFTSVAFCHKKLPSRLVRDWPGGKTSDEQVPTTIQYMTIDNGTRTKRWGHEVRCSNRLSEPKPLEWFKLLLQTSSQKAGEGGFLGELRSRGFSWSGKPSFVAPDITPAHQAAEQLKALGMPVTDVIADFLKCVREVIFDEVKKGYCEVMAESSTFTYMITVPALWSDTAKNSMIKAVETAGYGEHGVDFHLVGEPESAAAQTLSVMPFLKVGDVFVVVDAGGGTVDLISYKIAALEPLRLIEIVGGVGQLCGSVYLDDRFDDYIRGVLGEDYDSMPPGSKAEMKSTWIRNVKTKFGNSSFDEYEVMLPGIPDDDAKNIKYNFHVMDSDSVQKIFDPIIDQIIGMIKEQVSEVEQKNEKVTAIMLVGGFGSSAYLRKQVEKTAFGDAGHLRVLQPPDGHTAIAHGAVLNGLDTSIVRERRSRRYYGVTIAQPYEPGKGHESQKVFNPLTQMWLVPGWMEWFVKRNTVLGNTMTSSVEVCENVPLFWFNSEDEKVLETKLYSCDLHDAPEYKWQNPGVVEEIGTIKVGVDKAFIESYIDESPVYLGSSGIPFVMIICTLKMSLVNQVITFERIQDGKVCGKTSVQYK